MIFQGIYGDESINLRKSDGEIDYLLQILMPFIFICGQGLLNNFIIITKNVDNIGEISN